MDYLTLHNAAVAALSRSGTVIRSDTSNIQSFSIGYNAKIHSHVWIGSTVKIGRNVMIQAYVFIPNGVTIGDDVFLGPRVTFLNDKHPPSDTWSNTTVENKVAVGGGAVVLPGVTLGEGCVIGAGAVVTKNVPPGETWVGNPARKLERG